MVYIYANAICCHSGWIQCHSEDATEEESIQTVGLRRRNAHCRGGRLQGHRSTYMENVIDCTLWEENYDIIEIRTLSGLHGAGIKEILLHGNYISNLLRDRHACKAQTRQYSGIKPITRDPQGSSAFSSSRSSSRHRPQRAGRLQL